MEVKGPLIKSLEQNLRFCKLLEKPTQQPQNGCLRNEPPKTPHVQLPTE